MAILNAQVRILFSRLEEESRLPLNPSPFPLTIKDTEHTFTAYYAFFGMGAVRAEVSGDDIIGVSVWNRPGSINEPEFHLNTVQIDVMAEIDTISKMMRGLGNSLMSQGITESEESDIDAFMSSIGNMALNKKVSQLYISYIPWASVNDKKELSQEYFMDLAKQWLVANGKGMYSKVHVERGKSEESTVVEPTQALEFKKNITSNEVYYKAKVADQTLRKMSQADPLVNAVFLCGMPSEDRDLMIKQVFQEEEVWDRKVVQISGIMGFASLLQSFWENRHGKILLIKDSDRLFKLRKKKNLKIAYAMLESALDTEKQYRIISYSREKKELDAKK